VPNQLHLVKIPLRPEKLVAVARQRGLPLCDLDDGYLSHCVLREIWQERAPSPFVVRDHGRALDLWGYTEATSSDLVDHARAFGDPALLSVITDLDLIATKPMPRFDEGRRLGFRLRACPIVRLARAVNGHQCGAEVDAFLARCFIVGSDVAVNREQVYRDWLTTRLNCPDVTGVRGSGVRIAGMKRGRVVRRTHAGPGKPREAHRLERPDVHFEGELIVVNSERFGEWLGHGVGRHRAFGFGAVILVPPTPNDRSDEGAGC
jgi:CRISPR system Cascade subunit CasE